MSGPSVAIDWSAPWLEPWALAGRQVEQALHQGLPLQEALNLVNAGRPFGIEPAPVRFVAQGELPEGMTYEAFVSIQRYVPVRPALHDLFNGLCWMRFPRSKARLNAMHMAQIALHGTRAPRGRVRDALTLFDENAALLDAPQPLWEALAAKDWPRLFITLRPMWREAKLVLFGHALLEKLAAPRKAVTAHVWRVQGGGAACTLALDAWLSGDLSPDKLAAKPFAPLPVLGVPAWWPANEDPAFYGDASVFRWPAQSRNSNVPSGANA